MKIQREYLGFVAVDEIHHGENTVDWVVGDQQARKLARLISGTSKQGNKFNFKLVLKPRKDHKYALTVASAGEVGLERKHYPPTGQLDFMPDGYRLEWSNRGLGIQVTDYHVGPLVLPWELILDLARASSYGTQNSD